MDAQGSASSYIMLGMGLFRRRNRDDQPVDMDGRSPQLGLKYKDLALLGQLMQMGADLSQPRHVVYYSYATSPEAARQMATAASGHGFDTTVGEPLPECPDQWSVKCEKHAVLAPDFIRDNTDYFEALAFEHDAEYDGWEAAV